MAYTQTGEGAVVMTNAQGGTRLAEEIMRGIAAAYDWPDFRQKERALAIVAPTLLARYVGTYSISAGPTYGITLDSGQLYATPPSGEKTELLPQSATDFFLKSADADIQFVTNADGEVNELKILHDGRTFSFQRVK